jgi:hypothetical protein
MKVTIETKNVEKKVVRKYPYYGKATDEMIVLFCDQYTGTLISKGDCKSHSIGFHSYKWLENDFTPMNVEEIIFKVVS